jgi:hypothetical protein
MAGFMAGLRADQDRFLDKFVGKNKAGSTSCFGLLK